MGAQARLVYQHLENHQFSQIETVLENHQPYEFVKQYEAPVHTNTVVSRFIELEPGQTRCETVVHYTSFKDRTVKWMARLFPRLLKRPIKRWLQEYRAYAEQQG